VNVRAARIGTRFASSTLAEESHRSAPKEDPVKKATLFSSLAVASLALTGCEAIKGIFKAGVVSGVIVGVILFAIVVGAFALLRNRT
jgi:hypothetical protein